MEDDLPLIIQYNMLDNNCLEYLVGETEETIELAGKIIALRYKNLNNRMYIPYETEHINSYLMKGDDIKKAVKLNPNKPVLLQPGENIAFGIAWPMVVLDNEYVPTEEQLNQHSGN